jgi:hypothetical protein
MSCQTSTWASQLRPAPIPTVGIAGNLGGQLGRHHFHHHSERACLGDRDRVVDGLLGGVPAALHPETAEGVDALRGEADVCHHRDAGGAQGRDLRGDPLATLQLDGMRAGFLHEPDRGVQRRGRARLVAAERQVGDHQSVRCTAHDAAHQWNQLVDRDRHRGVVAVDDVGGRITDQQHRDTGVVEDPGGGVVVGREHRPLVAFGLHFLQVVDSRLGPRRSVRRRMGTVNSLFRHHCP